MAVTDQALARASAMGKRAGRLFVEQGLPTPNPFDNAAEPELAAAWRRAYFRVVAERHGSV